MKNRDAKKTSFSSSERHGTEPQCHWEPFQSSGPVGNATSNRKQRPRALVVNQPQDLQIKYQLENRIIHSNWISDFVCKQFYWTKVLDQITRQKYQTKVLDQSTRPKYYIKELHQSSRQGLIQIKITRQRTKLKRGKVNFLCIAISFGVLVLQKVHIYVG